MKINPEYMLRNIVGEYIVVPTGKSSQYFNGLITLNEVALFIWQNVDKVQNREDMVELLLKNYEVERAVAVKDVNGFLDMLKENHILLED